MIGTGLEARLEALDTTLFAALPTQASDQDKASLLRVQVAVRELQRGYTYLEIGSYLGGSIQPHLLDAACARIYSIDRRPAKQPDDRGLTFRYPDNSTERMLEGLGRVAPEAVAKIEAIDGDTRTLDRALIREPPQLCFIDGEHTDEAVLADARFCLDVLAESGALVFHDANVVYNGLWRLLDDLRTSGRPFHAYNLPDLLFVVEMGDFPLHRHPSIAAALLDNWVGYLTSLRANDSYRRWANLPPIRAVRALKARLEGTDTAG
jgi:hypothetical protein